MITYMLFIWTTVAASGDRFVNNTTQDWRPATEFATLALCQEAARELAIQNRYRCVKTK
jgi:hypothetical protein